MSSRFAAAEPEALISHAPLLRLNEADGAPQMGSPIRVAETRARDSLLGEARPSCITAQQRRGGAGETVLVCKGTLGLMGHPRGVMLSAAVRPRFSSARQ